MDAELIFSQLANFGFPVMLSWYLLIRMESKLDKRKHQRTDGKYRARRKLARKAVQAKCSFFPPLQNAAASPLTVRLRS